MAWRNSSRLKSPWPASWAKPAKTVFSQSAWKTGSSASTVTGPKPCIPPRSWIPFMAHLQAGTEVRRRSGGHAGPARDRPAEDALLEGRGGAQDGRLLALAADEHHAHGQALDDGAGDVHGRVAGDVEGAG